MNPDCPGCQGTGAHVVRNGCFFRCDDSRKIQRFRCKNCTRSFSSATLNAAYHQQKRRINHPIKLLLASGMSLRRIAKVHSVSKCTVAARPPFLAEHQRWLRLQGPFDSVQFDDLETYAMFRANVNRLIRKTWCTTKRPDRLREHLEIFGSVFNQGLMDSKW